MTDPLITRLRRCGFAEAADRIEAAEANDSVLPTADDVRGIIPLATPPAGEVGELCERLWVLANALGGGPDCDAMEEAATLLAKLAAEVEQLVGMNQRLGRDLNFARSEADRHRAAKQAAEAAREQAEALLREMAAQPLNNPPGDAMTRRDMILKARAALNPPTKEGDHAEA